MIDDVKVNFFPSISKKKKTSRSLVPKEQRKSKIVSNTKSDETTFLNMMDQAEIN